MLALSPSQYNLLCPVLRPLWLLQKAIGYTTRVCCWNPIYSSQANGLCRLCLVYVRNFNAVVDKVKPLSMLFPSHHVTACKHYYGNVEVVHVQYLTILISCPLFVFLWRITILPHTTGLCDAVHRDALATGTAQLWTTATEERFHGNTEFTVLRSVEEHVHCTVGEGQDSDASSKNVQRNS